MKPLKRPVLIALLTLIHTLLYGSVLIGTTLSQQHLTNANFALSFAIDFLFYFAYAWALFFSLRFLGKRAFQILIPVLFLTSALASYYVYVYKINIGTDTLGVALEVEPTLLLQFITARLLLWLALSLVIAIPLARFCIRHEQHDPRDKMVLLVSGMFVFTAFFMDGGISRQYLPYNYLLAVKDFIATDTHEKIDISQQPATLAKTTPENMVVVMVVGESVRPDHWQLGTYKRATNPLLSKRSNLTFYDDVPSCGPFTRDALPCLLSRASYLEPENYNKETSFISIFRKLGFYTAWVDMQGSTASVFDSSITSLIREANQSIAFNTNLLTAPQYDEALLPVMDTILKEHKGRVLLVLHQFGSHWPYDSRYPEAFRKFTPTCSKSSAIIGDFKTTEDMKACDHQELINAYDNSILYLDFILNQIITRIENRPAILVYTSDHGESLGEDGYYMHGHSDAHGNGITVERRVPVVVWHSDSYPLTLNTDRITHNAIFHSILDCAGITSGVINKELSICN
jgi:glucan phosphoethanolaminetransferase (alkaline phosphatase superfamily)